MPMNFKSFWSYLIYKNWQHWLIVNQSQCNWLDLGHKNLIIIERIVISCRFKIKSDHFWKNGLGHIVVLESGLNFLMVPKSDEWWNFSESSVNLISRITISGKYEIREWQYDNFPYFMWFCMENWQVFLWFKISKITEIGSEIRTEVKSDYVKYFWAPSFSELEFTDSSLFPNV